MDESNLLAIKEHFPGWARQAFQYTMKLNYMQSKVYPKAFLSDDNLLICAPTGAGKTNVALMTVLRTISHYVEDSGQVQAAPFKMIYVSPMKALASEIVTKFGKSLAYLGVRVREFTGDMQLSQKELAETHVIVTTPEKWDVVTRKSNQLIDYVKLIIFD